MKDQSKTKQMGVQERTSLQQKVDILERREAEFRFLAEGMGDVVFIVDMELQTTYVSPSIERVLGFTSEERATQKIDEQLTPKAQKLVFETLATELELEKTEGADKNRSRALELEYYHKDGSIKYLDTYIRGMRDSEGTLTGFFGLSRDVTDRKRADEALRDNEELYRTILQTTMDGFWITDMQGCLLGVNEAYCRMIGYSEQELLAMRVSDLEFTKTTGDIADCIQKIMEQGENRFESQHCRKDGSIIDFEISVQYLPTGGGRLVGFLRDITEHKRAEGELLDSKTQLQAIFDTVGTGILIIDSDTQIIIEANQTAIEMTGLSREKIVGQICHSLVCPAQVGKCPVKDLGQSIDHSEKKLLHADGHEKDILKTVYPITIKGRDCYIESFIDISDRLRAVEVQRASEIRFRQLADSTWEGILIHRDGVLLDGNQALFDMFGYETTEAIGRNFLDFIDPEFTEKIVHKLKESTQSSILHFEGKGRKKDGTVFPFEALGRPITHNNFPARVIAVRDLTERMQAEEAVRDNEERLRRISSMISDITYSCVSDEDGIFSINWMMGAAERVTGYSIEEIKAKGCWSFLVIEEDQPLFEENVTGITPGSYGSCQLRICHKNGSIVWLASCAECVMASGKPYAHLYGGLVDITDRKQAEQKLQDTLESLRKAVNATVQVLVTAVETRDPYTAGHQKRSAALARAIATEMGLSRDRIDGISMAGSIHDIGKLSVPAEILSKPTNLTEIEYPLIKEHAKKGFEMLKDVESQWPLAEMVYQHHERMDGSGYPRGLKGEAILMEARILAVADVVESMASHRPYRPALGLNAALAEIENNKRTLYDADAVDACLRLFREKGFQLEGSKL